MTLQQNKVLRTAGHLRRPGQSASPTRGGQGHLSVSFNHNFMMEINIFFLGLQGWARPGQRGHTQQAQIRGQQRPGLAVHRWGGTPALPAGRPGCLHQLSGAWDGQPGIEVPPGWAGGADGTRGVRTSCHHGSRSRTGLQSLVRAPCHLRSPVRDACSSRPWLSCCPLPRSEPSSGWPSGHGFRSPTQSFC